MKKHERREVLKRLFSFTLAMVMLVGYLPATASAAQTGPGKIADPATFERLEPDNAQYLQTLEEIENGGAAYRRQAGNFRGFTMHTSPFLSLCLCYLCNLFCCGGRFFFCC